MKKDLTDQVFGRLTVLYESEPEYSSSGKKYIVWHCKCECGKECNVKTNYLTSGRTKSCGCYKSEKIRERCFKNLTGMKFGKLTVIDENKERNIKGKVFWNCICECGNKSVVAASNLTNGHSQSCGCVTRQNAHGRYEDLSGQIFGRLTVIEKIGTKELNNGNLVTLWKCKCSCGNEVETTTSYLKNGKKKSCGCLQFDRPYNDLSGQRFGKLLVLERTDDRIQDNGRKRMMYKCLCDCGNICEAAGESLVSGGTKSCGCEKSYGEYITKKFLEDNNIEYEAQKIYPDLLGIKNGHLSYDFYLPQYNLLIECQGGQHYFPVPRLGGVDFLEKQQEHDRRKREYAKLHNIELYEINYKDYSNIENILKEKLKIA